MSNIAKDKSVIYDDAQKSSPTNLATIYIYIYVHAETRPWIGRNFLSVVAININDYAQLFSQSSYMRKKIRDHALAWPSNAMQ